MIVQSFTLIFRKLYYNKRNGVISSKVLEFEHEYSKLIAVDYIFHNTFNINKWNYY